MASQSSFTNTPFKKLTINDLPLLCNALNPVAPKCCALGLQLGVKKANLDIIKKNNKDDCQAQLREIISERLKQDSPLTWRNIVIALRSPSVNHPDLAREIESWYISPLELQQHPASDPQQYLPLGGECLSYLWETLISNEMGPHHGENYHPTPQMMDETPMWEPPDGDHFQFPSLMSGPLRRWSQSPVRGPSDRGHYRFQSPVRGLLDRGHYRSQSPVREPSDRGHYRSQLPVREPSDRGHYRSQSTVRGSLDRGHYRSQSPVREPSDRGHYRSQLPVREPSDRGHYRSQSPVKGPSDRGHYRSQSPVREPSDWGSQSPVREPSDRGHYRSQSPVRGLSDRGQSWSLVRGASGKELWVSVSDQGATRYGGLPVPLTNEGTNI